MFVWVDPIKKAPAGAIRRRFSTNKISYLRIARQSEANNIDNYIIRKTHDAKLVGICDFVKLFIWRT